MSLAPWPLARKTTTLSGRCAGIGPYTFEALELTSVGCVERARPAQTTGQVRAHCSEERRATRKVPRRPVQVSPQSNPSCRGLAVCTTYGVLREGERVPSLTPDSSSPNQTSTARSNNSSPSLKTRRYTTRSWSSWAQHPSLPVCSHTKTPISRWTSSRSYRS